MREVMEQAIQGRALGASTSALTEEYRSRWQLPGLWFLCDRQITVALYSWKVKMV